MQTFKQFILKKEIEPSFRLYDKELPINEHLEQIVNMFNKNYISCEIFRKKYKIMENFVVIGLRDNGKNVKRRTSGFAKEHLKKTSKCIYCGSPLNIENATTDHIVPISEKGNNCQVNLIVCCKKCNGERGNLPFMKYLKIIIIRKC